MGKQKHSILWTKNEANYERFVAEKKIILKCNNIEKLFLLLFLVYNISEHFNNLCLFDPHTISLSLSLSASSLIFMCFNEDCYKQVKAVNRCRVKGSSHSLVSFHFCLFVFTQVLHFSTTGFCFIFNIFCVLFICKFAPVKEIISEPYIFLSVS